MCSTSGEVEQEGVQAQGIGFFPLFYLPRLTSPKV